MSEERKKWDGDTELTLVQFAVIWGIFLYVITSAIVIITITSGDIRTSCNSTFYGDYVFPARKIGCWLSTETKESKDHRIKHE